MRSLIVVLAAALAGLALAPAARAQHGQAPHGAAPSPGAGQPLDMQGDPRGFINNAHVHKFYDLSVATLKPGAPPVDVKAYEQKSYAIFRAMGASMGWKPGAMEEHLKAIPRQVIQIVKDDPTVLDNFEAFADAMVGPK